MVLLFLGLVEIELWDECLLSSPETEDTVEPLVRQHSVLTTPVLVQHFFIRPMPLEE